MIVYVWLSYPDEFPRNSCTV